MLVTLYWPLIGLSWQTTPSAQVQVIASEAADVPEIWPLHCSTLLRVFNSRYTTPMAPKLFTSSVPKEILLHRLALSMLLSLLSAILASSQRLIASRTWALDTSSRLSTPAAFKSTPPRSNKK